MTVRRATPADAAAIARVHVAAWRVAYRGLVPDAYLDDLGGAWREQHWAAALQSPQREILVAVSPTDSVEGFVVVNASRDDDATRGAHKTAEIAALYVAPDHWRRGRGSALLASGVKFALERGFDAITLWVLASNAAARAFYETHGFTLDGREKTDESLGFPLFELRYARRLDGTVLA